MTRPFLAALLLGSAAAVQANDQAVKAAPDAFGTSVGRESIGLYSTGSVRGFSPTAAGNVRIDGLYFDQVWGLSARLRTASQVRVGLSAQGFAFPAPTGIVDHQLRRPGAEGSGQVSVTVDHFGGRYLDLDFAQPLGSGLGVTGGVSLQKIGYGNGTQAEGQNASLALWWRPREGRELMAFVSEHHTPFDQIGPQVSPAAAALPDFDTGRRFGGPAWSVYRTTARNQGVLWRETEGPWQWRAGLFHSEFDDARTVSHLILDADASGLGQRVLFVDPPGRSAADSGELRLTHTRVGARWQQRWHLQLAARERMRRYGGAARVDLGPGRVNDAVTVPEPPLAFGAQSRDAIRQHWLGLAYEARLGTTLEWNAGLQHTRYRKRLERPGLEAAQDRASPLLGNLGGAWTLQPGWVAYAGFTRGLEESGLAPANAVNRNQALPAIRTDQRDAGLRVQLGPHLRWVAGYFDVRKPYANLDAAGVFTQLGEVRHRGIETSLAGHPHPALRVLAGAVWMQPRVRGEAVALGRVGPRPVGQPQQQLKLNAVWTPPALGGTSFDAGLSHTGAVAATRDNRAELPAVTLLDLGLRVPLQAGPRPVSLRLRVANAADHHHYELRGAGLYAEGPRRQVELALSGSW